MKRLRKLAMIVPLALTAQVAALAAPSYAASTVTVERARLLTGERIDVQGYVTCTAGLRFVSFVNLEQGGAAVQHAEGSSPFTDNACTGSPLAFQFAVERDASASTAGFRRGPALVSVFVGTYSEAACTDDGTLRGCPWTEEDTYRQDVHVR